MERLTEAGDELRYKLKKAWRDGTRIVTLDPHELIARICAMVPPPRFQRIRFHGVFSPNSALRGDVVASARPNVAPSIEPPEPLQLRLFGHLFEAPDADVSQRRRKPWAWLLRYMFAIDVSVCPECCGPMKWREVALTADASRRKSRGCPWRSSHCRLRRRAGRETGALVSRELARVFACADTRVCPQVKETRRGAS